jgi:two-component system phosphate regulon sensor histidine kinase PhoR
MQKIDNIAEVLTIKIMYMKTYSPKSIALLLSGSYTVLFISIVFIVLHLEEKYWIIVFVPAFFGLTYSFVNFLLNKLIESKIRPIYKTIREVPVEGKKLIKKHEVGEDIISEVDKEVTKWATDKIAEIERLRGLEKYRKDFLGNVSHELKTPVFNIQGYILTLLDGGLEDDKINRLYLKRTEKSIDRMINIVEDLESITKLESGELKLNRDVFDIVKLIEDVFEMETMEAQERKISLEFIESSHKPLFVKADKKRFYDVVSNLVVNALKYGRRGGFVKVGFFDMDDHVLVEVSDNGIGIGKSDLPRIFERFYRVDKSRSREQGGTGLGLAIVKHIIEAHEQTFQVNSVIDKGSTFTFTIEKVKAKNKIDILQKN